MNRMPFQRASEEKLRTRRIVSVGGRFRRAAAETPDAPADETSRSTSTVDSRRRPPPRFGTGEPPYQPTRDKEQFYLNKSGRRMEVVYHCMAATPRGAGLEWRVTRDDDTYEWTYVGAYARSESASSYLENKIRYLNRQKYDMFNENCQYYSKAVAEECIRDEEET